jgi:hypothetical protein
MRPQPTMPTVSTNLGGEVTDTPTPFRGLLPPGQDPLFPEVAGELDGT